MPTLQKLEEFSISSVNAVTVYTQVIFNFFVKRSALEILSLVEIMTSRSSQLASIDWNLSKSRVML